MTVAIYVRVSTQRQALPQTIEPHLQRLYEHSQTQGWPWQEEHIFRDDGYSGASLHRPGLDRLREQVSRAVFDRVIRTAPDRLARNSVHQMLLIEEFEQGGCQVEFVDRPMSQDPHDQLLLPIRRAVAEYERSLIAERMRRGRLQKYQAGGLLPWTHPPSGFRVDPLHPRDPTGVRLEPAEVAVVTDLFARYLEEGASLKAVTKQRSRAPDSHPQWAGALESSPRAWHPYHSGLHRNHLSRAQPSDSSPPAPLPLAPDWSRPGRTHANRSPGMGGTWSGAPARESGVL
jgi:site-specific DNA recombinase